MILGNKIFKIQIKNLLQLKIQMKMFRIKLKHLNYTLNFHFLLRHEREI